MTMRIDPPTGFCVYCHATAVYAKGESGMAGVLVWSYADGTTAREDHTGGCNASVCPRDWQRIKDERIAKLKSATTQPPKKNGKGKRHAR